MNLPTNQKGISPIFVSALVVVILGSIGFAIFVYFSAQNRSTKNINIQKTINPVVGLETVSGDSYVFYYPEGFIKLDKKRGTNTVLYYAHKNKSTTDEAITFASFPPGKISTPSLENCKELLSDRLGVRKEFTIVDAKPVESEKEFGCEFIYTKGVDESKLTYHARQLWRKSGDDERYYSATASYLDSSPQNEKDLLNLAVNNFTLK